MTRETKIGLLVGLAFVIVIGVLLSDHQQRGQQPRPVDPNQVTKVIDQANRTPGRSESGETVSVPPTVVPSSTVTVDDKTILVRHREEENPGSTGIGGTASGSNTGRAIVSVTPPVGGGSGGLPPTMNAGQTSTGGSIGPEVTPPAPPLPVPPIVGGQPVPAPVSREVKHVAAEGDSIYKMTVKYYGGYTPAREAAIVKANPKLKGQSSLIVVGQEYVIPDLGTGTAAVAKGPTSEPGTPLAAGTQTAAGTPTAVATGPGAKPAAFKTYTIKEGDTLSKIATKVGKSVDEIAAANKDVLKNAKYLRIGQVLKIPTEKILTASVQ